MLDPNSDAYKKKLNTLLRAAHQHEYIQCQKCGYPTHKNFICLWCEDESPMEKSND